MGPAQLPGLDALVRDWAARVRVVFCDLDNTLLTSASALPGDFDAVAGRLAATGVRFVPATGRTLHSLSGIFAASAYARGHRDFVASNGMDVLAGGAPIRHLTYDRALVAELVGMACADPERPGIVVYTDEQAAVINLDLSFFADWGIHDPARFTAADRVPEGAVSKVALVARHDIKGVIARYQPRFEGRLYFARCGQHWIDLPLAGAGKGSGALAFLSAVGAGPQQAMALGDSMNDAELMRVVGAPVAVANALPDLKSLCSYQVGACADGGALQALSAIARAREGMGLRAGV